jgi:hypothetical protein
MPMDVPSIVGHGWRQGSLFTLEASQALLGEKRTHANSRLILASQDCDIVHRGNGEPFVDTFEAKPILVLVPTESRARNARHLHLPLSVNGVAQPHQIKFWSRLALPRERLAELAPDPVGFLTPAGLKWFRQWLGSRYDRPALPDAFNSRLAARDARRAIREILTPCEHCFDDLYLYIDPADDELEPNISYVARVALIMSELDTGNADIVALAQKGQTELETFLKSCPGIEVQTVEVISNVEFTLADLDLYRPWDYSDLSLPDAE